jgi:hypothetical protein
MKCPWCSSPMSFFTSADGLTEYVYGCGSRTVKAENGGRMDSQAKKCLAWAKLGKMSDGKS